MRKIIIAGILTLTLVAAAYAKAPTLPNGGSGGLWMQPSPEHPLIKPGERRFLAGDPTPKETKELIKEGVILKFNRLGMLIISASGTVFLSWQELMIYRYMIEKQEAKEGPAI